MNKNIYKKRWKKIKEKLKGDAFIVSKWGNMKYLSCSHVMDKVLDYVIIPKDGEPIGVASALEGNRARSSAIRDIRIIGNLPFVPTYEKNYRKALKKILEEIKAKKIVSDSKIGIKAKVNDIIKDMRIHKDRVEIKLIHKACDIAKKASLQLNDIVKVGGSEIEISIELNRILNEYGSQTIWPFIVAAGKNSTYPHHFPTDKIIKKGDVVVCDFGAYYKGYVSDVTKTIILGDNQRMKRILEIVLQAENEAIESIAVNEKFKNIDMVARKTIQKHGFGKYFVHSLGHGLGLEVHEPPLISPNSKDKIERNMVFTIEPGIYLPGMGGVRIEDDILVGKDIEILT